MEYTESTGTASEDHDGLAVTWAAVRDSFRYLSPYYGDGDDVWDVWPPEEYDMYGTDTEDSHTHSTMYSDEEDDDDGDENDEEPRREEQPYCLRCNRFFISIHGYWSHCRMSGSHPWWCAECHTDFDREGEFEVLNFSLFVHVISTYQHSYRLTRSRSTINRHPYHIKTRLSSLYPKYPLQLPSIVSHSLAEKLQAYLNHPQNRNRYPSLLAYPTAQQWLHAQPKPPLVEQTRSPELLPL